MLEERVIPGLNMPLFAPLAADQVWDLLAVREMELPKERIPRGTDLFAWYLQRLLRVQNSLLPDIANARQRVFALLDPVVHTGQLTRRWLVDTLYPPPLITYPDRLREWNEEHFLLFDQHGEPEPQAVAAILLQRELDTRRRKLPQPRGWPRSYFCFRYDSPGSPPVPYELPLVPLDVSHPTVLKATPAEGPSPYLLSTVWKGASWDDPAWLVLEEGATRWVGQPSEGEFLQWLAPHELESLAVTDQADQAKQALSILATHLLSHRAIPDKAPQSNG